ncbi:MAG: hypothetical protein R3F34_12970 [Planctomycetota bacterium]
MSDAADPLDDGANRAGSELLVDPSVLDAPVLGPYCPITGARRRPWWSTSLYVGFHAISLVAIYVGANHLHTHLYGVDAPGRTGPVLLWTAIAVAVYVTGFFVARLGFAARLLLTIGAVWAIFASIGVDTPLVFADAQLAWTQDLDAERARVDDFLQQAGFPSALTLFAATYALLALCAAVTSLRAVVRSWNLPRRMWFARYHPVWRRRYSPDESAHPVAGILFVRDDEILTDKLVWLVSKRDARAFRFAPPSLASDPPAIPLGGLAAPVTIWNEGEAWWRVGSIPGGPNAPAVLRLVGGRATEMERDDDGAAPPTPLVVPIDPSSFPVTDVYATDEACIAKHYLPADGDASADGVRPGELLGLLFDSRPSAGAVPRCSVLLREGGRVRVEYPHPDLLGAPHAEDTRVLLPWRGTDGEPATVELDGEHDSVHWVDDGELGYHLLFLTFERRAR